VPGAVIRMNIKKGGIMTNLIEGVKKFSTPMFVLFVFSKVLVGIGLGVVLVQYLAPYGCWFLGVGVVLSVVCAVLAAKKI